GTPTEPEQRARHELGIDDFLRRSVELGLERTVDPVEKIEMADPDDPHHDVRPPENELQPVVHLGIHRALLTAAGFAVACAARIICPPKNSKIAWPSSPARRAESAAPPRS